MTDIPSRDITGQCEGECRNLVFEGEARRQAEINAVAYSMTSAGPSVAHASSRNEPPGFLGGHV